MTLPATKSHLRKHYHDIRQRIPAEQRYKAAQDAAAIFATTNAFRQSTHIACYMAFKDEFDTTPLIRVIWQAKKHCYLPVLVRDDKDARLRFIIYNKGDPLHHNRFGIPEPAHSALAIEIAELDIVITPLIAFDRQGNRLGTGGGYYDHTFKDCSHKKPPLIGLGYAAQEAPRLKPDPWDVAMSGVITEKEFIVIYQ